jgi:1-acyl-sn-glycerol-3-phosphate acyltransferase
VPIVPIIIANSSDSLPKAGFFIRPAPIDVTVLPPIPTKDWSRESIDSHIDEIRQKFLEVLGQTADSDRRLRRVK